MFGKKIGMKKRWFAVLFLVIALSSLSALPASAAWKKVSGKTIWVENGKKATGWKKIGNYWFYFDSNGILQTSRWIGDYYVNAKGARVRGFVDINNKTYYFSAKTYAVVKGKRFSSNGKMYVTDKTGKVIKKAWIGSKYFATNTGALVKGFAKIGGNLYFFYRDSCQKATSRMVATKSGTYFLMKDGKAAKNKRVSYKNKIYGFGSDAKMVKGGFLTIGNKKYYFGKDGVMAVGLQTINGSEYYFAKSGAMAVSTSFSVGKYMYTVNDQGVVTKKVALNQGEKIAAYGRQFVGNPYVWGGTSLTNGADCSGFCQAVMAHFGISIPRVADDQMRSSSGVSVEEKDMLAGDLLFFGSGSYASHVVMYAGDGMIVHAKGAAYGIVYESLSKYMGGYKKILGIKRYWAK